MEATRPVLSLKSLNQQPKIGIGITTYKRPDILAKCLAGFQSYMPPNSTLFVNDDSERGEGIAAAKNRCLAALEDCDYIFLFDDDIWPDKKNWWKPFIREAIEHNCHVFSSSWENPSIGTALIKKEGTLCSLNWVCGVCVFLTSHVLQKIGGYNINFGRWGGEHEEYAQRAWLNGLTPYRLCDIDDSISYFHSLDKENAIVSTVAGKQNRTPQAVINHYMSYNISTWRPYKSSDIIMIHTASNNRSVFENWVKHIPESFTVLAPVNKLPAYTIPRIHFLNKLVEPIVSYLHMYRVYINSLTLCDPACSNGVLHSKQVAGGVFSSDEISQPWLHRIPSILPAKNIHTPAYVHIPKENIPKYISEYAHISLNPMFADISHYAAVNLVPLPSKKPLQIDMRPVVMILGCKRYRKSLELAIERFTSPLWHVVGVEGGAESITYDESAHILSLDTEDTYDKHPLKTYAAFMWILSKWPNTVGIFKTDEDILFHDIKELEMNVVLHHSLLYWGMRVEKVNAGELRAEVCDKLCDKAPGKTHPASHYCWGHGYYLSRAAVELLTPHRDNYDSQYLEDVCTGSCLNIYNIVPIPVRMKYIEVDRAKIVEGTVKIQEGHKIDTVAWRTT